MCLKNQLKFLSKTNDFRMKQSISLGKKEIFLVKKELKPLRFQQKRNFLAAPNQSNSNESIVISREAAEIE